MVFFFGFSFGCGVAGLCLAMKRVALGRFCGGAMSSWSFMLIGGGRDLQLILVVGLGCGSLLPCEGALQVVLVNRCADICLPSFVCCLAVVVLTVCSVLSWGPSSWLCCLVMLGLCIGLHLRFAFQVS